MDYEYMKQCCLFVESNGGLEAVKERLMPEGYSWPKRADGSFVTLDEGYGSIETIAFHYQTSVAHYKSPYVEINSSLIPNSETVLLNMGERLS